jgi:hypothetical protein
MTRREALVAMAAASALARPASGQIRGELGRPGVSPGGRPGVDEALIRTVTLVLRAEARRGGLPAQMMDPQPLTEEQKAELRVGARLPDDFPATLAPARVNRRLPHARGSSVWAVAGRWMVELDPVRLRILSVAPDVLPPAL